MTDGGTAVPLHQRQVHSRVARIRLVIMKCDKMPTVPNVQAIHGLRLQKVPHTKYVFYNAEFDPPTMAPASIRRARNSYTLFNVNDAEPHGDGLPGDYVDGKPGQH